MQRLGFSRPPFPPAGRTRSPCWPLSLNAPWEAAERRAGVTPLCSLAAPGESGVGGRESARIFPPPPLPGHQTHQRHVCEREPVQEIPGQYLQQKQVPELLQAPGIASAQRRRSESGESAFPPSSLARWSQTPPLLYFRFSFATNNGEGEGKEIVAARPLS